MTRIAWILLAAALAGACDPRASVEPRASQEDVDFATGYFARFQARDLDGIESQIDPGLREREIRSKLERLADFFPRDAAKNVRVVGGQTNVAGDRKDVSLSLEYEFPATWLLASVAFRRTGGGVVVQGLNIEPIPDSMERINRFTLAGKGAAHYVLLAWAIAVPLFILYALVLAVRAPGGRLKWLWCLAVIPGLVQISLNWTTGQVQISPLGVQLFGSGFARPGPYAPIVIATSIPIGAFVFWLRRRTRSARPAPGDET